MGFLSRIDRVLFHPWTTRVGAIQAIVGLGLLGAGLLSGAVILVFDFPTIPAILTGIGAFLVFSAAAATAIERYRNERPAPSGGSLAVTPEKRELREATGWLLEDLERALPPINQAIDKGAWWRPRQNTMDFSAWTERGRVIAILGYHDEHRMIRQAILKADWAWNRCNDVWVGLDYDAGIVPGVSATDRPLLEEARDALLAAIEDVERIQR